MCDKAVDTHSYAIEFVPECYKTQNVYDKALNEYFIAFCYTLERYKAQEMCYKMFLMYIFIKIRS